MPSRGRSQYYSTKRPRQVSSTGGGSGDEMPAFLPSHHPLFLHWKASMRDEDMDEEMTDIDDQKSGNTDCDMGEQSIESVTLDGEEADDEASSDDETVSAASGQEGDGDDDDDEESDDDYPGDNNAEEDDEDEDEEDDDEGDIEEDENEDDGTDYMYGLTFLAQYPDRFGVDVSFQMGDSAPPVNFYTYVDKGDTLGHFIDVLVRIMQNNYQDNSGDMYFPGRMDGTLKASPYGGDGVLFASGLGVLTHIDLEGVDLDTDLFKLMEDNRTGMTVDGYQDHWKMELKVYTWPKVHER